MQSDTDFKYWAFISYSHRDSALAEWLHRAIETYSIPRRMVGQKASRGVIPARLFPVFRDREELPTSSDLGANIRHALTLSRHLIVLCSPDSAESRWVNQEIAFFKSLGREDAVICLILDGEPNADDKPKGAFRECFPRAARFTVNPDTSLTSERVEPIAADLRPGRDERRNALLKIVAGLIGVGFDELRQRDRQRLLRRRVVITAFACIGLAAALATWSSLAQIRGELKKIGPASRWLTTRPDEFRPSNKAAEHRIQAAAQRATLAVDEMVRVFKAHKSKVEREAAERQARDAWQAIRASAQTPEETAFATTLDMPIYARLENAKIDFENEETLRENAEVTAKNATREREWTKQQTDYEEEVKRAEAAGRAPPAPLPPRGGFMSPVPPIRPRLRER